MTKYKVRMLKCEVRVPKFNSVYGFYKEERGPYQKALETAKNLAEMGFTVEAISKATGLSIEEVEAL